MPSDFTPFEAFIADIPYLQISHMQHNEDPNLKEYRYEQRAPDYALRCWHDGRETLQRGALTEKPEWLTNIIDTARVGGYIRQIAEPPPEIILWFCTDANNNLSHFIEMK